jgi:hypothetical protein
MGIKTRTIAHLLPSNANFAGFFPMSAWGFAGLAGFLGASDKSKHVSKHVTKQKRAMRTSGRPGGARNSRGRTQCRVLVRHLAFIDFTQVLCHFRTTIELGENCRDTATSGSRGCGRSGRRGRPRRWGRRRGRWCTTDGGGWCCGLVVGDGYALKHGPSTHARLGVVWILRAFAFQTSPVV